MKKARTSSKPTAKDSDIQQAIGGQPENDRDAREAGLSSATSADGPDKKARGTRPKPPASTPTRKKR